MSGIGGLRLSSLNLPLPIPHRCRPFGGQLPPKSVICMTYQKEAPFVFSVPLPDVLVQMLVYGDLLQKLRNHSRLNTQRKLTSRPKERLAAVLANSLVNSARRLAQWSKVQQYRKLGRAS